MSKHGNNGHFPPGVRPQGLPPGGKVLDLTSGARDQIQEQLIQKLQPHLNELNQENAAEQSAISLVFSAAVRHGGVEYATERFEACEALAMRLAKQNLKRSHEKAFSLFIEQKVNPGHIPAHIVRAARRQGVTFETATEAFEAEVVQAMSGTAPNLVCAFCGARGRQVDGSDGGPAGVETDHRADCAGVAHFPKPESADVGTPATNEA